MAEEASAPGPGGELAPRGEPGGAGLRASHDDRDRAVEVLRVAGGDDRLTAEELDERVGAALTARTYGELAALVADLPAAPGSLPLGSVPAPAARPTDPARIQANTRAPRSDGPGLPPLRLQ